MTKDSYRHSLEMPLDAALNFIVAKEGEMTVKQGMPGDGKELAILLRANIGQAWAGTRRSSADRQAAD